MNQAPTHRSLEDSGAYRLLPGESLIQIVEHPPREFNHLRPSSLREMLRLTRAKSAKDIGRTGPAIAALAMDETGKHTPDHLRLYDAVFGRDSLRVAIDLISSYPELARATIMELARTQGVSINIEREEEPGRIAHEIRLLDDSIAIELTKRLGWGWPYYGSVDATPEFIRTLTAYCQRTEENRAFLGEVYTDRNGEEHTMGHSLELALEWILGRLASNTEGLLEFKSMFATGIENQVWKDSWDAYHHADGTMANHEKGIASVEVQVTTYDTLIDAAELFEDILDNKDYAQELRAKAEKLKAAIFEHFWTNDKGGYFVLGTDRDSDGRLRQLKVRTSNMGHALNSRLLKGDDPTVVTMRESVVRQLFTPEMLAAAGIRTLASDEIRFRPGAYHNGSVWLWDTHHVAKGLRRLGYPEQADDLDRRILHAVATTNIFPEYVRGDDGPYTTINTKTIVLWDEKAGRENLIEQPPQEVQAWTVAAILATKHRGRRRNQMVA